MGESGKLNPAKGQDLHVEAHIELNSSLVELGSAWHTHSFDVSNVRRG